MHDNTVGWHRYRRYRTVTLYRYRLYSTVTDYHYSSCIAIQVFLIVTDHTTFYPETIPSRQDHCKMLLKNRTTLAVRDNQKTAPSEPNGLHRPFCQTSMLPWVPRSPPSAAPVHRYPLPMRASLTNWHPCQGRAGGVEEEGARSRVALTRCVDLGTRTGGMY